MRLIACRLGTAMPPLRSNGPWKRQDKTTCILPTRRSIKIGLQKQDPAGAFSESTGTFYNIRFPLKYKRDHHISQLEAINAVLAVKTLLPPDVSGVDVLVVTDNISSMYALNSGRTRDPILAACARELALIEALQNVTITLAHAAGSTLILADSLSRAFVDKSMNILAETLVNNKNLTFKIPVSLKYVLSPT